MTDYTKLDKALRCKRDDCEGCDLAFFDNDEGWMCRYAAKDDDAAAAIEALEADVGQLKAAVKGQEDGIKVLQAKVPHWVSVKDELPEPNIQCLVRDDDCNYAVGYYRQDIKAWDSPFFGWLERDDEYYKDSDLCRIGKVVAWMPLPKPPKEVQE